MVDISSIKSESIRVDWSGAFWCAAGFSRVVLGFAVAVVVVVVAAVFGSW